MDIEKEIELLKDKIDDAENEISERKGSISVNRKRLKDEFGLNNDEEILKFIEDTDKDLYEIDRKIEENYNKLKENV